MRATNAKYWLPSILVIRLKEGGVKMDPSHPAELLLSSILSSRIYFSLVFHPFGGASERASKRAREPATFLFSCLVFSRPVNLSRGTFVKGRTLFEISLRQKTKTRDIQNTELDAHRLRLLFSQVLARWLPGSD